MKKVFLGGTCNGSVWRDELIPKLEIEYFNPVVDDRTSDCVEEANRQKDICDYLLYVITPKMTEYIPVAELVHDGVVRPHKTIFCWLHTDGNVLFDSDQIKSITGIVDLLSERGVMCVTSLDEVAEYLNKNVVEDSIKENSLDITDEMREYSKQRTTNHIERVRLLGEKLGFDFSQHDHSKFSPELVNQYVLIDNSYRKDLDPPVSYTLEMAEASFAHIKQEHHHPEYWDDTIVMNPDFGQDKPDVINPFDGGAEIVNATDMSVPAICEMVCDWCAMSQEVGGHPAEWAQNKIGTKWRFTDEQEELIFLLIRMLWQPEELDEVEMSARNFVKKMKTNPTDSYWRPASELRISDYFDMR